MYFHVKLRKKGTPEWRSLRKDGKLVFFKKFDAAKNAGDEAQDCESKIIPVDTHPNDRQSAYYGKRQIIE